MKHVAWDYELPGYYHVYTVSDAADEIFEEPALMIMLVPQSTEADEIVDHFVKSLDDFIDRRLAQRSQEQG